MPPYFAGQLSRPSLVGPGHAALLLLRSARLPARLFPKMTYFMA
jgi:hypothetical protein